MGAIASQKRVMVRRRPEEHSDNHERWVISYADFVTLLFAFFVVMYSISSVNDGKYRVLSDSLVAAFQNTSKTLDPVPAGENNAKSTNDESVISLPMPGDFPNKEDYKYGIEGLFDDVKPGSARQGEFKDSQTAFLSKLSDKMATRLQTEIEKGDVNIVNRGEWIELSIQSNVLFKSGEAELSLAAKNLLQKTAVILGESENPVQVEGFTDNVPIETQQFPSNWELSASRAAAVVRWFIDKGINPARLAAIGYGEQRPVAANDSEEGRSKNRRIAIIVAKSTKNPQEKPTDSPVVDYKVGGESVNASIEAPLQSTSRVPLKIMTLQDGRLLFSADPGNRPPAKKP